MNTLPCGVYCTYCGMSFKKFVTMLSLKIEITLSPKNQKNRTSEMCIIEIPIKWCIFPIFFLFWQISPHPPLPPNFVFLSMRYQRWKRFFCRFPMNDIFCCSFTASLRRPQHRCEQRKKVFMFESDPKKKFSLKSPFFWQKKFDIITRYDDDSTQKVDHFIYIENH